MIWRLAHPAVVDVRFATVTSSCPPTWPTSRSALWPTARRAYRSAYRRRLRACHIAQLFPLCMCLDLGFFGGRSIRGSLGRSLGRRWLWIEVKECWIDWNIEFVIVDRLWCGLLR